MSKKRGRHMRPSPAERAAADAERTAGRHTPVMLREVLVHLQPSAGETYIDATFGAGGYTRAILDAAACKVVALDRDPNAVRDAAPLMLTYRDRLRVIATPFGDMADAIEGETPAGIVFDLGVSSMQLDEAERGFSFQADGPLDMRMFAAGATVSEAGRSAADIVNGDSEELIADILFQLGEERRSRAIAKAIVRRRAERPFERTGELAATVIDVLGRGIPGQRHPATRTFQALRLYVNDELGELARGLAAAEALLKPGGRLVVVTFHSLEDRIAKQFFAARTGRTPGGSRHQPQTAPNRVPSFQIVNPKALNPMEDEVADNPRSRSAKLRVAERTSAAAWPFDIEAFGLPPVAGGR